MFIGSKLFQNFILLSFMDFSQESKELSLKEAIGVSSYPKLPTMSKQPTKSLSALDFFSDFLSLSETVIVVLISIV